MQTLIVKLLTLVYYFKNEEKKFKNTFNLIHSIFSTLSFVFELAKQKQLVFQLSIKQKYFNISLKAHNKMFNSVGYLHSSD